mgnify:CR=1 FL=1
MFCSIHVLSFIYIVFQRQQLLSLCCCLFFLPTTSHQKKHCVWVLVVGCTSASTSLIQQSPELTDTSKILAIISLITLTNTANELAAATSAFLQQSSFVLVIVLNRVNSDGNIATITAAQASFLFVSDSVFVFVLFFFLLLRHQSSSICSID